jgi:hypothetical protein
MSARRLCRGESCGVDQQHGLLAGDLECLGERRINARSGEAHVDDSRAVCGCVGLGPPLSSKRYGDANERATDGDHGKTEIRKKILALLDQHRIKMIATLRPNG